MEGQQCDKCKGSFFNLQSDDPEGCIPCFCFQLSKDCKCADLYKDIVSHILVKKKMKRLQISKQNAVNCSLGDPSLLRSLQPSGRAAKSPTRINCRRLTERKFCYYGLLLLRELTHCPGSVHNQRKECTCVVSSVCIFVLSGLLWSIFLLFLVRLLSCVCFHILANTKPNWIVVTCYRWYILEILLQKIPAVVTQFAIYTSTQYTLFDIPPPPPPSK